MKIGCPTIAAIFLLCVISFSSQAHFYLHTNTEKCFYEDLNDNMEVLFKLEIPMLDPNWASKMKTHTDLVLKKDEVKIEATVRDKFGTYVTHSEFTERHQSLSFVSQKGMSGLYSICLSAKTKGFFKKDVPIYVDVNIDIDYDSGTNQYTTKDDLSKIDTLIQDLQSKMSNVYHEQVFFKVRERRFKQTSDSTYKRLLIMGFLEFSIALAIGTYQIFNLKGFLKQKKIA